LRPLYIDALLESVKADFGKKFEGEESFLQTDIDYGKRFDKLLNKAETEAEAARKGPKVKDGSSSGNVFKKMGKVPSKADLQHVHKEEEGNVEAERGEDPPVASLDKETPSDSIQTAVDKLEQLRLAKEAKNRKPGGKGKKDGKKSEASSPNKPASGKAARVWDDVDGKVSRKAASELDRSKAVSAEEEDKRIKKMQAEFASVAPSLDMNVAAESSDSESEEELDQSDGGKGKKSSWFSSLSSWTSKTLTAEALESIMPDFKNRLMTKNVAEEAADKICQAVTSNLLGKKVSTLSSMKNAVKSALTDSVTSILTPKKSIDVLRDALHAQQRGRPYVIVFVGVNGVGKSTSLSKVAYLLKSNGLNPMIAACDTFRSGAVEQLRTHSRCLDIPLYDRGYGKDPAGIAKEAIAHAQAEKRDCVLVDTAGRMQDNEPLMRSLAKLIRDNSPDLVLFVGEALVGNDAVDQIVKFDQSLMNYSNEVNPHHIDGILLTKCDTVDDKVGAALSMVYMTGQPIIFVGVGQTYADLKRMDVHVVTKALLK
jgi:signal recognition particle receptor subunit alpha